MRLLLILLGLILFTNGSVLFAVSNVNTGLILTVIAGIFFLLWGFFYNKINEVSRKGVLKWVKKLIVSAILFETVLIGYVAFVGEKDNVTYGEDVLIVLGAGLRGERITLPLKMRLDKALEYHEKNPDALIIVSGGQGYGEDVTEAFAMKRYLVQNGVPEEIVVEEDKATSTSENMKYSKDILENDFGYIADNIKIAFVTNNFHVFRSIKLAQMAGIYNVTHLHTSLQWYNYIPNYIRETLAIFKMWLLKY